MTKVAGMNCCSAPVLNHQWDKDTCLNCGAVQPLLFPLEEAQPQVEESEVQHAQQAETSGDGDGEQGGSASTEEGPKRQKATAKRGSEGAPL